MKTVLKQYKEFHNDMSDHKYINILKISEFIKNND